MAIITVVRYSDGVLVDEVIHKAATMDTLGKVVRITREHPFQEHRCITTYVALGPDVEVMVSAAKDNTPHYREPSL